MNAYRPNARSAASLIGQMAERLKAPALKVGICSAYQGFESPSVRCSPFWNNVAKPSTASQHLRHSQPCKCNQILLETSEGATLLAEQNRSLGTTREPFSKNAPHLCETSTSCPLVVPSYDDNKAPKKKPVDCCNGSRRNQDDQ